MSVSDSIADMLTKIRNASMAGINNVDIKASKLKIEIIKIFKNEGYIKNYKLINEEKYSLLRIFLKYDESEKPIIHGLKKISKPGRRVYMGYKNLPRIFNGLGTLVVATSMGVITGKNAHKQKVGGELICSIW